MASAAPVTNGETVPQIAMFINESYSTQPPAAPWPPLPPSQGALPPAATAPPPLPTSPLPHSASAALPSQYPPLPAVMPVPASTGVTQSRPAPATCPSIMPTPNRAVYPLNQPPPPVPPSFDPSRPPPPIPTHIPTNNQLPKRKLDSETNAGPNKMRKPESSELGEILCENCVQRELRINSYKIQMEVLHNDEETQILLYKKKLQEYEIGKDILKAHVGPDMFQLFNELIEGSQTPQIAINSASTFTSGASTVPMQALLQLLEMFVNGSPRNMVEPLPSTSRMDETLQSLTSLSRRLNVNSYTNSSPDILNLVRETLRTSGVSEKSSSLEVRSSNTSDVNEITSSRKNGFNHLSNGQISAAATYSTTTAQHSQDYGTRAHQLAPNFSAATPTPNNAPVPPMSPMFHPAIPPPPNGLLFSQNNAVANAENTSYYATSQHHNRATSQPQPMPPIPNVRPNAPNFNYMARYPHPPFFPPYQ